MHVQKGAWQWPNQNFNAVVVVAKLAKRFPHQISSLWQRFGTNINFYGKEEDEQKAVSNERPIKKAYFLNQKYYRRKNVL